MTGHQINSLVGDLVAMAQAMERLPQVEQELKSTTTQLEHERRMYEDLKTDLEQSKSYAASLEAKVHAAEVARDDAELRFLELDERMGKVLSLLSTSICNLGKASDTINPPKPEPQPQPEPVKFDDGGPYNEPHHGDLEADAKDYHASQSSEVKPIAEDPTMATAGVQPIEPKADTASSGTGPDMAGHDTTTAHSADTTTGQSDSHPTSAPTASPEVPATTSDASPTSDYRTRFAGRDYFSYPGWVSRADWLAGGGTDESYDYRPPAHNIGVG